MTLSNDIAILKSHLKIENTQMRHRYQNTSGKKKINTVSAQTEYGV